MAAESNVGARLFLIGKDSVLAGLQGDPGRYGQVERHDRRGGKVLGHRRRWLRRAGRGLEALGVKMDLYRDNLATVNAETDALAKVGKVRFPRV